MRVTLDSHLLRAALCAIAAFAISSQAIIAGERCARFRAGNIISAEISSAKPEVQDESPFEPYKDMKGISWAQVVVRLDKGRSLGVADYSLIRNGVEYKCLAIAEDDKAFSLRDQTFAKTNMFGSYKLLFPVQTPATDGAVDFELRFKLLASPMPDIPLKFRSMGANPFTEPSKLPQDGALGLSAADLKPAKKPEAAPAATAAPATAPAPAAPAAPAKK